MRRATEKLKAFGRALWHNVGKYVVAMVVAGAVSKHLPQVDPAVASTIGTGVSETITQSVGP